MTKRSDLKSVAGVPSQSDPIYLHTARRRNRRIGSLDADALKFDSRICHYCNTTRTQPHDMAWQQLSESLRFRDPPLIAGQFIRCNSIFPYDTRGAMRDVNLYLVKLFGGKIMDGNITSLDIKPFSEAILKNRVHPNVYAAFGPAPEEDDNLFASASDVQIAVLNGKCAYAVWIQHIGNLWVRVMYAAEGEKRRGLVVQTPGPSCRLQRRLLFAIT